MSKTTDAVYEKLDIACEYLDLAMQLYIEERNYFCAIHLAGAAEELFGKHLPEDKRNYNITLKAQKSLAILEDSFRNGGNPKEPSNKKVAHEEAKSVLNGSKNMIKHMDDGKRSITMDPALEAQDWIERAISNFSKLKLPKSETLWKYQDYSNKQLQQEFSSIK